MTMNSTVDSSRRRFLQDCGKLAPSCVLLGYAGGLATGQSGTTKTSAPSLAGTCRETLYRDQDSCIYVVELDDGEYTIGFGPPDLDPVARWEQPELIAGQVPTVVCHADLQPAARARLAGLLEHIG